jgi:acyl-CoA synthetase (AMP-forming)/AMP-acid ligase II
MAENVFAVTQTEISIPAPAIIISQGAFDDGRAEPAEPGPNTMRIASCGRTLPYTEVGIADASRASLGEGLVGEVTIRSPHLFIGYNGRDDLTERALDNGTYYTGDLGFILGGELYLTGRKDDLILAYGRNLLAHELEALVNSVVGVKPGRVTVFDVFSETAGSNVLIVMAEMLTDTDPKEVSRAIRVTLDAAAAVSPQSIVLLNQGELLKTTSGKISRSGNRAAYMESQKKA